MKNATAVDPVCGKEVDILRARAVGIFAGATFYFCSAECKARYGSGAGQDAADGSPPAAGMMRRAAPPDSSIVTADASDRGAPRYVVALAAAVLGVAGLGFLVWNQAPPGDAEPAPSTPVARAIAAPPVAAPAMPAPAVAAAAPAVAAAAPARDVTPAAPPISAPASLTHLTGPLKLALRRFVEPHGARMGVRRRLLVVDASGHQTFFDASVDDLASEGLAIPGGAIPPTARFVATSAALGVIFEDAFAAAGQLHELRVVRMEDALVIETRVHAQVEDPPSGAPVWQTKLRLALAPATPLRGAALALKRYLPEPDGTTSE